MESIYPIVYCHGRYLFPRCTIELPEKERWRADLKEGDRVVVYTFRGVWGFLCARGRIATLSTVISRIEGKGSVMVEVRGEKRVHILSRIRFRRAVCSPIAVTFPDDHEDRGERLRKKAQEFVFLIDIPESDRLIYLVSFIQGLPDITDFIAHYFIVDPDKKQILYNLPGTDERSAALEHCLDAMIDDLRRMNERLSDEKKYRQ
jgi:hypothetical protein